MDKTKQLAVMLTQQIFFVLGIALIWEYASWQVALGVFLLGISYTATMRIMVQQIINEDYEIEK